jgi:hypothetical protein
MPQNFRPWIHLTPPDFNALTRNRTLCDEDDMLSPQNFEVMMREQVRDGTPAFSSQLCSEFQAVIPQERLLHNQSAASRRLRCRG